MNNPISHTVEEYKITYLHQLNEFILETSKTEYDFFEIQLELYSNANVCSSGDLNGELYGATVVNLDRFQEVINFIRVKIAENKHGKPENNEILSDLSDTSQTEKLIYLHKLGIIDFLKTKQPFNTSTNSLSTVLSAVTGIPLTSLSPMLRRIIENDSTETRNPLYSEKAVLKVKTELNKIGFNS